MSTATATPTKPTQTAKPIVTAATPAVPAKKQGQGKLADQIIKLRKNLTPAQIQTALDFISHNDADVVRFAFKSLPDKILAREIKLSQAEERTLKSMAVINNLSVAQVEELRGKLLADKAGRPKQTRVKKGSQTPATA